MEKLNILNIKNIQHELYLENCYKIYVDIARLLLELNHVCYSLSNGKDIKEFYVQERNLYAPLKNILECNLPSNKIVNEENLLYKTNKPKTKTDISIKEISHSDRDRKDPHINYTHFIEIKSLFYKETISKKDIQDDLLKLLECKNTYNSKCFFVLIGLKNSLKNSASSIDILGNLDEDEEVIKIMIDDTYLYLRPAGNFMATEPFIFVFEISGKNDFYGKSGIEYLILQKH